MIWLYIIFSVFVLSCWVLLLWFFWQVFQVGEVHESEWLKKQGRDKQ
jgi:beta-lactam-binding protein with PASTA domain